MEGSNENDSQMLKEKLQIKTESLLLLSQQLENLIKENHEYKRIIDTLYDKNITLKKKLFHDDDEDRKRRNSSNKDANNNSQTDIDSEGYIRILKDLIRTLKKEKQELFDKFEQTKQQLNDYKADLKLLREQLVRQRVGNINEGLTTTLCHSSTLNEREMKLIKEFELLKEKQLQSENDLKLVLCEKEELKIERDTFKLKFKNLNELISSKEKLEEIVAENQRLKADLTALTRQNTNEQFCLTSSRNSKNNLTKNQIKLILAKTDAYLNKCRQLNKSQNTSFIYINDLFELSSVLFDNLLDKNVALDHQRKCNRMLADRIRDLESELSVNKKDLSLIKFDDDFIVANHCEEDFFVHQKQESRHSSQNENRLLMKQPSQQSRHSSDIDLLSTSNDRLLNSSVNDDEEFFNRNFNKIDLNDNNVFMDA